MILVCDAPRFRRYYEAGPIRAESNDEPAGFEARHIGLQLEIPSDERCPPSQRETRRCTPKLHPVFLILP